MILARIYKIYRRAVVHNTFSLTKMMGTTQILGGPCHLGVQQGIRAPLLIEKNTNLQESCPFGEAEVDLEILHAFILESTPFTEV